MLIRIVGVSQNTVLTVKYRTNAGRTRLCAGTVLLLKYGIFTSYTIISRYSLRLCRKEKRAANSLNKLRLSSNLSYSNALLLSRLVRNNHLAGSLPGALSWHDEIIFPKNSKFLIVEKERQGNTFYSLLEYINPL